MKNDHCDRCSCHWKLHVNYDPLKEIPPPKGDYYYDANSSRLPDRPQLLQLAADVASDMLLGGGSAPSNGP
jgi:hypothetical protein